MTPPLHCQSQWDNEKSLEEEVFFITQLAPVARGGVTSMALTGVVTDFQFYTPLAIPLVEVVWY